MRRRAALAALAVVLLVVSWRTYRVSPLPGFDPSWTAGLHMAAHARLEWGDELVYVYGPLGFLTIVRLFYVPTALLALAYVVGTQLALCLSVVVLVARRWPWWAVVAIAFVAAKVADLLVVSDVLLAVGVLWSVAVLRGDVSRRAEGVVVPLLAALGGLTFLTKFNSGVLLTGVAVLTAIALARWFALVAWPAAVVVGWLATGNRLGDLARYVRNGAEVSSGHSTAMGLTAAHAERAAVSAVVVVVALVVAVVVATAGWTLGRRAAACLIVAGLAFGTFKHGFVRQEPAHLMTFFGMAVLVAVAFTVGRRTWSLAAALAVLVAMLVLNDAGLRLFDPVERPPWARYQVATMASASRRRAVMDDARASLRAQYAIDDASLALARGHTVDVQPWEEAAVWAYGLDAWWRPLPVFQAAVAYTSHLDGLNASFLRSSRAPERILRQTPRAVDGRHPAWESPAAVVAMVCRYREIHVGPQWQVLARSTDRCGRPRAVATVDAAPGATLDVPRVGDDELLVARIRGVERGVRAAVRALVWKSPTYVALVDGGARYRLVPQTASDGLLLDVPDRVAFSRPFGPDPNVHTLALTGIGHAVTVEFVAIPLLGH